MSDRIPYDELSIIRLSKIHDLRSFTCGDGPDCADLDEFLKEDALKYQENSLATTYICLYKEQIVGYLTICTGSVQITCNEGDTFMDGLQLREIPGLKIARLATHKNYQRRGIGEFMILSALRHAREIKERVGIRVIIVDSKEGSVEYYEKKGFRKLKKYETREHPCLYIDISKADLVKE